MTFLVGFILNKSQMLLSFDLQCQHLLHSLVNNKRIRLLGLKSETPSTILSIILFAMIKQTWLLIEYGKKILNCVIIIGSQSALQQKMVLHRVEARIILLGAKI